MRCCDLIASSCGAREDVEDDVDAPVPDERAAVQQPRFEESQVFQDAAGREVLRNRTGMQLRQFRRRENLIDERTQRFPRKTFAARGCDQAVSKLGVVPRTIVDANGHPADVGARLPLANQPFKTSDRPRTKTGWTSPNLTLEFLDRNTGNILELSQVGLLENAPQIPGVAVVHRDQIEPCGLEPTH